MSFLSRLFIRNNNTPTKAAKISSLNDPQYQVQSWNQAAILTKMGISISHLNISRSTTFPGTFNGEYKKGNSYFIKCNSNEERLIITYLLLKRGFHCNTFEPDKYALSSSIYVNTTGGYFQHAWLPEWADEIVYTASQFIYPL